MMITIAELLVYPVKSCAGISMQEARVGRRGLLHDRQFLVVDEADAFVTQRTAPELAQVRTALSGDWLILTAHGAGELRVPLSVSGEAPLRREITIFRDRMIADDAGDEAAEWFSILRGERSRLVRLGQQSTRSLPLEKMSSASLGGSFEREVAFTDAFPTHVASMESLADLNTRLPEPIPMNRFRPNIVVQGGGAYAEHDWPTLRANGILFRAGAPCQRCVITTINQAAAKPSGPEPLRMLATYRRVPGGNGVVFGQYFAHEGRGTLHVGDELIIESAG